MDVLTNGRSRLGFGLFEADLSARELYRRGALVHVQEQPFQVLAMLLARPGELVTREELRKKLWPDDTFVDFDEGVNTAIKKLRCALGDSSENPRFIETLPRRGYRFIAPLRAFDGSPLADSNPEATAEIANRFRNDFRAEAAMHFSIVVPPGLRDLALSRDGRMLAFIAPGPEHYGTDLWVQEVGAAGALCFENTEGASYPFWSPDSRSIAFFAEGKLKRVPRTVVRSR
jgi:DNA-binding winged helix-turn-helix (wHTH) protein